MPGHVDWKYFRSVSIWAKVGAFRFPPPARFNNNLFLSLSLLKVNETNLETTISFFPPKMMKKTQNLWPSDSK